MTDTVRSPDPHERRRLDRVRPPGHVNPTPRDRYHLVVLGAGTGGLVTAAVGAALGARVALVEKHFMGGDCLNVGCVPSKAILRAARAWDDARRAAEAFGGPGVAGPGRAPFVLERMRRLRADLSRTDSVERFAGLGVDVFLGEGRFAGPEVLEVGGARLVFRRAVIATGARAALPDVPGLREAEPLTNETIFDLADAPARLVILGAGPIGCEMAQAWARLGSRVTLLGRADRVLPRDDPDASALVEAALRRDGVDVRTAATAVEVRRDGGGTRVLCARGGAREEAAGDALLVAAGRLPNVEGLGLEAAGVGLGPDGIAVDPRLRTANRRVYALGDVVSRLRFTHLSDAQARLVVRNALFFGRGRADRLILPWCTYTSPEVAHVGLDAAAAARAGAAVETLTVPLAEVDRAVLDGATEGFLRLHLRRGTDRILGATLVADHAGEMIGEAALAMTAGAGLDAIGATIHPYPTQSEIFRKAADARRRGRLTPAAKRAFALFFRLLR